VKCSICISVIPFSVYLSDYCVSVMVPDLILFQHIGYWHSHLFDIKIHSMKLIMSPAPRIKCSVCILELIIQIQPSAQQSSSNLGCTACFTPEMVIFRCFQLHIVNYLMAEFVQLVVLTQLDAIKKE
jgi:hypothetical protein